jgi:hypothetical protein
LLEVGGVGNNIAVRLVGTGLANDGDGLFEEFDLPPLNTTYFDVDLIDVKTGNVIGVASDCFSDITPIGDGLMLSDTTFLSPSGTLISQGLTTVQLVLHGSADFTHITGAIPSPGDDSVIYGDSKFSNASGSVRLSGAVNLDALGSDLITFDCMFLIDV